MTILKNDILTANITPEEAIKRIFDNHNWVSHVNEKLRYREYVYPDDTDESLDNLIYLYTNKKSKRVCYAGKKLKNTFLNLPSVEQRKVGLALLGGGMTDSEWVCKRLDNYKESFDKEWKINWHPCYENAVEECWNKYHGKYCGKLLIQFLPEGIVRKYIDELTDKDFYFYLARRFVNASWFKLDVEKLKRSTYINAYLSVMLKANKSVSAEEARLLLYQWISVVTVIYSKRLRSHTKENIFYSYKNNRMRVINTWGIDTALYYLLCMNHHKVVSDFLKWDKLIFDQYYGGLNDDEVYPMENCNGYFPDIIRNNFPKDLKYLLYLNKVYYDFIFTPGQPLTVPRFRSAWSNKKEEDMSKYVPPYNLEKKDTIVNSKEKEINKEAYNNLLDSNPVLKSLVDKLNLSHVNTQEEEKDDDTYLIEKDLPF